MRDVQLDELVVKAGSKYTLVVAVAKRAQQIRSGAIPLVDVDSQNPVTQAIAEIASSEVLVNPAELLALTDDTGKASDRSGDEEDFDLLADVDLPGDGTALGDDSDDLEDLE